MKPIEKIYSYSGGEHRFDKDGLYLGFFPSNGRLDYPRMAFFKDWEYWDEKKHDFLTKDLGFKFINPINPNK